MRGDPVTAHTSILDRNAGSAKASSDVSIWGLKLPMTESNLTGAGFPVRRRKAWNSRKNENCSPFVCLMMLTSSGDPGLTTRWSSSDEGPEIHDAEDAPRKVSTPPAKDRIA